MTFFWTSPITTGLLTPSEIFSSFLIFIFTFAPDLLPFLKFSDNCFKVGSIDSSGKSSSAFAIIKSNPLYNGFDLIIAKADDDFPEESIEPTLKQLSENLRKGSRSGANVKIKIRKLEKISDGVSKPVVIGEVQKNVKMN